MKDLVELDPCGWDNQDEPRGYMNDKGDVLSVSESKDIVDEIISEGRILVDTKSYDGDELLDDDNVLFVMIDDMNDDSSKFTTFMDLFEAAYPSEDISSFRKADELMECTYEFESEENMNDFMDLLKRIGLEVAVDEEVD